MQTANFVKCTDGSYDYSLGNYVGQKRVHQGLSMKVENATLDILDKADEYKKQMLIRKIMIEQGLG